MRTTISRDALDVCVEQRGDGPDVLLIAGLGDPIEAWDFQLEGLASDWRLVAYDNRGVGRTPLPPEPFSVAAMADAAAAGAGLGEIAVPTLVLTGELDLICPPRHGRQVAVGIPGARFELLAGEAHQPFQESPEEFNQRVAAFWREVDAR